MADKINDGGNAFPATGHPETGMTLRDFFAAAALQGMASGMPPEAISDVAKGTADASSAARVMAVAAFSIADAMLKAREAK